MSKRFRKLAHSLYACKDHIVFCPKYRYRMLPAEVSEYVKQQIYRLLGQRDGVEVIELNVQPDMCICWSGFPPKRQCRRSWAF